MLHTIFGQFWKSVLFLPGLCLVKGRVVWHTRPSSQQVTCCNYCLSWPLSQSARNDLKIEGSAKPHAMPTDKDNHGALVSDLYKVSDWVIGEFWLWHFSFKSLFFFWLQHVFFPHWVSKSLQIFLLLANSSNNLVFDQNYSHHSPL